MNILSTNNAVIPNLKPNTTSVPTTSIDGTNSKSFGNYLKDALSEVNGLQQEASASSLKLAMGDNEYLHNTTIAYEKAILGLQLTIEIRNKLVSAYEEIMRMQI